MLVLTRKVDEAIQLGNMEVTIRVVDITGGRVRLGISAPQEIRVTRQEKEMAHSDSHRETAALAAPHA